MYDYIVFIGRFQIPHNAHFKTMVEALKRGRHLIIGIGSANVGRSLRNPFTFEQRASFIEHCQVPEIIQAIADYRISFVPIDDSPYSDQWWVEQVQRKVRSITRTDTNVALIGANKDETSYYLHMFPQWELVELEATEEYDSTACRNAYYQYGPHDTSFANMLSSYTTQGVIEALKFIPAFVHESLQKRYEYVQAYQKEWGTGPFEAVDSVVIKNAHVLMIKRGGEDFNSHLWALPGGFLDKCDPSPRFGALRELYEETGLDLRWYQEDHSAPVSSFVFDNKHRDDRAHIRTHGFCFKLLDTGSLPEVQGLDDAAHAEWVPLVDLYAGNCFNDHYFVIRKLIAGL